MTLAIFTELGSGYATEKGFAGIAGNGAESGEGQELIVSSPIDGKDLGRGQEASEQQVDGVIECALEAFVQLRSIPAPVRGELVRRIGEIAREHKEALAEVIRLEVGKITQEALGEVQEWIDICDFATGLSRQLYGLTIASERPGHRMMEQWHPLGPVAVITAFNFPMAVWAWNAMIGIVCGNPIIWKPSEKTPLCALAVQAVVDKALDAMPDIPGSVSTVVIGGREVGEQLSEDSRIPLVSATGSVSMGKKVAQTVGARLGRSLLELGGNNAMILSPSADLDLALRAIVFSAVGTAGQRCTSLRRLICHRSRVDDICHRLVLAYQTLPIGNPVDDGTLVGPLINQQSFNAMQLALGEAQQEGGQILFGGDEVLNGVPAGGFYVRPAIVRIRHDAQIVRNETFAPILYVLEYEDLDEAITIHNAVPQGLSSAIFTENLREAEQFLSSAGSDCGMANVNIGTSGAEIGGAFGGEKETGGGRESGSDAWKSYMRRVTNTINYGGQLPLAQGVEFG